MNWQVWIPVGVVFVEVLALVFLGRVAAQKCLRRDLATELTTHDNPAAALAVGGYHLALFLGLAGLLAGESKASLLHEVLVVALHGVLLTACLLLSGLLWRPALGLSIHEHVCTGRNVAAGLVCGSSLVATGLIYQGSVQGEGGWVSALVFFALGQCMLIAASLYYDWVSPVDVQGEVATKGNLAAALGQAGALLATGLVVGHAVEGDFTTWSDSLRDFFLLLVPVLALPLVRWLVARGILLSFADLDAEITRDRNPAAGLLEAVAYVGCAAFYVHMV